jgi:putative transposase
MTNHAHLIISTEGEKMEDILRDLKKFTAKAIVNKIRENGVES